MLAVTPTRADIRESLAAATVADAMREAKTIGHLSLISPDGRGGRGQGGWTEQTEPVRPARWR